MLADEDVGADKAGDRVARIVLLQPGMTRMMRLSAALLLVACFGCGAEDPVPGPADPFVGTWQGPGTGYRYSGENGEYHWGVDASATITRVSSSVVAVDSSALSGFCKPVYDIGDDGLGALRPAAGSTIYCDGGSLALKDAVLSLDIYGTQNHLVYNETWSVTLELTRMQ